MKIALPLEWITAAWQLAPVCLKVRRVRRQGPGRRLPAQEVCGVTRGEPREESGQRRALPSPPPSGHVL